MATMTETRERLQAAGYQLRAWRGRRFYVRSPKGRECGWIEESGGHAIGRDVHGQPVTHHDVWADVAGLV